ncbi:hypothetical protein WJX81_001177 [Elliptochloris bilobata]|uniref:Malic enzyme n=1 Tax=Elliptochloris bilobata TaxID=381761 RepID=A0AAW1RUK3_9CHLO
MAPFIDAAAQQLRVAGVALCPPSRSRLPNTKPSLGNSPQRLPSCSPHSTGQQGRCVGCCASTAQACEEAATTRPSTAEGVLTEQREVVQLYRSPGLSASAAAALLRKAQAKVSEDIVGIDSELCFNVALRQPLAEDEAATLAWLLRETYEPERLTAASRFDNAAGGDTVIEVGPRLSFQSAWSTNAVSICASCGLAAVTRLELSRRFRMRAGRPLSKAEAAACAALVHDRMTEEVYSQPLRSFRSAARPAPVFTVPVLERGRAALEEINAELGLAFDEQDLVYYTRMFVEDMKRDPTNVELFDIAQSNSEHSRHWFFGAQLVLDGEPAPETLMQMVKATLRANPNNSVIGFKDNSSAIRGGEVEPLLPVQSGAPCAVAPQRRDWDLLLTAETHNFPCAVAPYPGAETGAGGRMRDTHATGIGSLMGAGLAGYCVGNLRLEGASAPWEDPDFAYPDSLASPLQILIDASNGASDYGNKFGEPLLGGYTRTFGLRMPSGQRREWIKPIMFSAGLGQIDHTHLEKAPPQVGMLVVKIGGPAYRIGMGGGAASSVPSGSNAAELDFNAVQRGDAEMAQKLWRVVRACVELGPGNPIQQIHDQGAGGNCNVVKEIIYPLGATIDVREIRLGDETMSVLEIWGAEYQENDCLLIRPSDRGLLEGICARERAIMQVIGSVSGSGRITLADREAPPGSPTPVDLDLEKVLGDMPQKTFEFRRQREATAPLALPEGETAQTALARVLALPAVGSKRFLTTKADRSVTGLVAQQQCCGPLQLPVADVAVMAQAHTGLTGAATAIGEQPLKGLVDPAAMARLALAEALTNLVWAAASGLADVKASVNWMYAAKMGAEGAAMYDAAAALRDAMIELGLACDGGKDSLSMAAGAGGETVKAPGNLVVSAYVACPDITLTVTPDLKLPDEGRLVHVDLTGGRRRLGGSALAHAYGQIGDEVPDVAPGALRGMWDATQALLRQRKISAGHDVSDGGLAVALLEMAFAGNCGLHAGLPAPAQGGAMAALFAEEPGLVLEVALADVDAVLDAYAAAGVAATVVGTVTQAPRISIAVGDAAEPCIAGSTAELRDAWEATGFRLERLQAAPECVAVEQAGLATRGAPTWAVPWTPAWTPPDVLAGGERPRVAVLREEGSNGDREMAAALHAAGLEPWDVAMSDLLAGRVSLDGFAGLVAVGGFSYADVLDSAKGWAGAIRRNARLWDQFLAFRARPDTFSLGVCNGAQLFALLGWVPGGAPGELADARQPRFVHNASGRFESRWVTVRVEDSPSVLLKGMAGARMGIWCAHGEGRAIFPDASVMDAVLADGLAPSAHLIATAAPRGAGEALGRWEAAIGNLEDARVALDVVAKAIDDAVFLDEDAFRQVAPVAQYARQLQAQMQRVAALETELEETSAALARQQAAARIAERRAADLTQELENNAVVFRMHYTELLSKDEEIAKLQAVIQVLSYLQNEKDEDIAKYLFLRDLQERDPQLFYTTLIKHAEDVLPFVYTPTVGQACQRYHLLQLTPRGLYLRATEAGHFLQQLCAWPRQDIRVVVVTDGERVLGLGDLGAGGLGIVEGKALLYTAAAGLDPALCLPVCLDVGTNNAVLLDDPAYKGLRQRRIAGAAYDALLDEFMAALRAWQRHVLLQFEDFANHNAFRLLARFRERACCFNDDVQGTACIALAGLLSALRATGGNLAQQRVLFYGAGEAGTGIAELIAIALHRRHGLSLQQGRRRCFFMDSRGLVCASRRDLQPHKLPFAHDVPSQADLLAAVRALRPTALIGVSTARGAFSAAVLRAMAELNARPIIFPLSNPNSKAECTFREALDNTSGRVLFASGSPFPPVAEAAGVVRHPAQANNAYVFPAIGMAAVLTRAAAITDDVFLVAAEALAHMTSVQEVESGLLFPRFSGIRGVSAQLAGIVAERMVAAGLGSVPNDFAAAATARVRPAGESAWEAYVRARMYEPQPIARL